MPTLVGLLLSVSLPGAVWLCGAVASLVIWWSQVQTPHLATYWIYFQLPCLWLTGLHPANWGS